MVNKAFIDLTMKAHGKADLYFHAYFWEKYLKSLQDAQIKLGIKSKPKQKKAIDDDTSNTVNDQESEELGPIDIFSDQYPFMKRI